MKALGYPVVAAAVLAGVGVETWRRYGWLCWPIGTTAWSLLAGRRPGPNDEADLIA